MPLQLIRTTLCRATIARIQAIALATLVAGALATGPRAAYGGQATRSDVAASARLVDEAEQAIKQAGRSDPIDTGKIRGAIDQLKRAATLNPRNDSAYVDLGFCYALLKDAPAALSMYRKAVAINPSPANYKELADIYMRAGAPEEALMAANAGLTKGPRDAGLYNARGMALMDLRRYDEAARDFRKALEIDPSLRAARINLDALGESYTGRGTVSKKSAARGN